MFDYIRCERPLPDGWQPAERLQTRDFDCELVEYVITTDGRLLCDRGQPEGLPTEYLDFVSASRRFEKEQDKGFKPASRTVDTEFDGVVHFGGLEVVGYESGDGSPVTCELNDGSHVVVSRRGKPIYKMHNYRAAFIGGRLVEIVTGDN